MGNVMGLEIIEVVEQAAIASARWMGKGEKDTADAVAVDAMRALGGHFQGQLIYDPEIVKTGLIGESKESNLARLQDMGIDDPDRIYEAEELACGETVLFAACGLTPGNLMKGVRFFPGGARTESLIISTQSKTVRFVDTIHKLDDQHRALQLH